MNNMGIKLIYYFFYYETKRAKRVRPRVLGVGWQHRCKLNNIFFLLTKKKKKKKKKDSLPPPFTPSIRIRLLGSLFCQKKGLLLKHGTSQKSEWRRSVKSDCGEKNSHIETNKKTQKCWHSFRVMTWPPTAFVSVVRTSKVQYIKRHIFYPTHFFVESLPVSSTHPHHTIPIRLWLHSLCL